MTLNGWVGGCVCVLGYLLLEMEDMKYLSISLYIGATLQSKNTRELRLIMAAGRVGIERWTSDQHYYTH